MVGEEEKNKTSWETFDSLRTAVSIDARLYQEKDLKRKHESRWTCIIAAVEQNGEYPNKQVAFHQITSVHNVVSSERDDTQLIFISLSNGDCSPERAYNNAPLIRARRLPMTIAMTHREFLITESIG